MLGRKEETEKSLPTDRRDNRRGDRWIALEREFQSFGASEKALSWVVTNLISDGEGTQSRDSEDDYSD